jgi:hypothetical protein
MMDQELKAHLEAMEVRLVEKIRDTALLTARSRTHTATSSKMAHTATLHEIELEMESLTERVEKLEQGTK